MPDRNPRRAGEGGDHALDLLIAIAGRQHADQLAAALVEGGLNAELHHAAPIRPELDGVLAAHHRYRPESGLVYRTANRLFPRDIAQRISHAMFAAFDWTVARDLPRLKPRAVIVYENGALRTLRAAKKLGIPTILDAASVHHRMQAASGLIDSGTAFRNRVNARKDIEIGLADHVLTCSTLARDSYVAAGVPAERVHVLPLGFEPGSFAPGRKGAQREGPLRIAFVGRFTRVKGADLLAIALDSLRKQHIKFECRIAATKADGEPNLVARLGKRATLLDKVPHDQLAELYRWADILVQPSRFDSFGLVVPEALACGVPVLASDHVGASDFITSGVNGYIIPSGDAEPLSALLADMARDPSQVRAMRPAAIAAVSGAAWSDYRHHAIRTVCGLLGWPVPGSEG